MTPQQRQRFDELLEQVLSELPQSVQDLLQEVPLFVEDFPSAKVLRDLGLESRDELCGLYTGIPLIKRSVEQSGELSDCVILYRDGILQLATNQRGRISRGELKRQIRITILHELGHHHGLEEEDLEDLGYG